MDNFGMSLPRRDTIVGRICLRCTSLLIKDPSKEQKARAENQTYVTRN
jgi:hypothetical protein